MAKEAENVPSIWAKAKNDTIYLPTFCFINIQKLQIQGLKGEMKYKVSFH